MNKKTSIIALLVLLTLPILVTSQSSELGWGFSSGETFYFKDTIITLDSNATVFSFSFEYSITTESDYEIPDPLTSFPFAKEEAYFQNGSSVYNGPVEFAVPLGDWALLEDTFLSTYSSTYDDINFVNEESVWGYITKNYGDMMNQSRTVLFSKSNGVLISREYLVQRDIGYNTLITTERIQGPLKPESIIILVGISTAIIVLAGVYFYPKQRPAG